MSLSLRRPDRSTYELALRCAIGAGLALWVGTLLGLEDPYWGAVSAVVATAGTLGASLGASIQRTVATLIALVIGLGFAALPWGGNVVSGLAVGVTFLVMVALKLDAGARLAAASTLIVTAIPNTGALDLALGRGLNVPLGCVLAVQVGLVVFPHRASTQLRGALRADAGRATDLAAAAVFAYLGDPVDPASPLAGRLARLEASVGGHRAVLRDAGREPGSSHHLADLERLLHADEALVDDARGLVQLAAASKDDRAPVLVADDLRRVAEAMAGAATVQEVGADADPHGGDADQVGARVTDARVALADALEALDQAFTEVRRRLATVEYPTDELTRLLSVMRRIHGVALDLDQAAVVRA